MVKRGRRLAAATMFVAVLGTAAVGCSSEGSDVTGPTTPATGATSQTGAPPTTGASTGSTTGSTSTTGSGSETSEPTSGATSGPSGPTFRTPSPLPPTSGPKVTNSSPSPLPSEPPASTSLSGTWSGEWVDGETGVAASLVFTLQQHGSSLDGSITIDGTSCLSGGPVDGEVHGHLVRMFVRGRELNIVYDGSFEGREMSGTYASTCDAPHGTWQVTQQKQ